MMLAVFYIANVHSVEKKLRKAQALKSEIRELNYNYLNIKSDIVHKSTRTQVAEKVEPAGLKSNGRDLSKINAKKNRTSPNE